MSLLFIQDCKKVSDNKIKVFHLLIKPALGCYLSMGPRPGISITPSFSSYLSESLASQFSLILPVLG